MSNEKLLLGEIVAAHGIKGLVKVRSFTETPEDILAYGSLYNQLGHTVPMSIHSLTKGGLLMALPGITNRNDAEALKGTQLFIKREKLPFLCGSIDEYYYADLIGMSVILPEGEPFGKVKAMHDFGAGDLIEIQPLGSNETTLLRFDHDKVLDVNLDSGCLVIAKPAD
jgi:16S rRNA processing protein RimM